MKLGGFAVLGHSHARHRQVFSLHELCNVAPEYEEVKGEGVIGGVKIASAPNHIGVMGSLLFWRKDELDLRIRLSALATHLRPRGLSPARSR
jgi:hypothetical protein